MDYEIIKTGSKGNCIIVEKKFMLDCGVPYKSIKDRLKDIKLIFISHEHSDHLNKSTVKKIAYEHPNIKFLCGKGVYDKIRECQVNTRQLFKLETGFWYSMGSCIVKLDYLYHDVPNYCLHLIYKNKCMFYCTDTSRIDHVSATGYSLYLIEANYDTDEELDTKIEQAHKEGKFTHLERVRYTHLSQLQALNWLYENMNTQSKYVFIHQHIEKEEEL